MQVEERRASVRMVRRRVKELDRKKVQEEESGGRGNHDDGLTVLANSCLLAAVVNCHSSLMASVMRERIREEERTEWKKEGDRWKMREMCWLMWTYFRPVSST